MFDALFNVRLPGLISDEKFTGERVALMVTSRHFGAPLTF